MGLLGLVYLMVRAVGKVGGAWLGGWWSKAQPTVRNYVGFGLLSRAGVAVGLSLTIANRFDAYGPAGAQLGHTVVNVIAATTLVVQIIGPIMAKFAIGRAGEIGQGQSLAEVGDSQCEPEDEA